MIIELGLAVGLLGAIFGRRKAPRRSEVEVSQIRLHARRVVRDRPKKCVSCGKSGPVQAAHVKPVRSFGPASRLDEINHPKNIRMLCFECHKKFDRWR